MMHYRLQSLLKVLVLSITFFVFYGCVTPYSPPTLSDFSTQEIDNLVAQAARPTTLMEHNLSASDLIGEWDLTEYNISSCAIKKGRKSKSRMIKKYRFQFYENMTFREFWKYYGVEASGIKALGGGASAGKYTYENGIITLMRYREGAFRPLRKYQVTAFSSKTVEFILSDLELEKEKMIRDHEHAAQLTGSYSSIRLNNLWHDSNKCIYTEQIVNTPIESHLIMIQSPLILHKSNIIPVSPPNEEEMGVGKEKVKEAHIPPAQSQPLPTQDSVVNVMQAVTEGINTFNQQMQQNAPQYQPPPSSTPRPTPAVPAQTNTQRTVRPAPKPYQREIRPPSFNIGTNPDGSMKVSDQEWRDRKK